MTCVVVANRYILLTSLASAGLLSGAACEGDPGPRVSDPLPHATPSAGPTKPLTISDVTARIEHTIRAASANYASCATLLGPHIQEVRAKTTVVADGKPLEELSEELTIQFRDIGSFHATSRNTADYGREVIADGGLLYLRPRYGKFHRRPPESADEPRAILDTMASQLRGQLELVAPATSADRASKVTSLGRQATKIELSLAEAPRARTLDQRSQKQWRQTIDVSDIAGDITFDDITACPVAANLRTALAFEREGKSFAMTTSLVLTTRMLDDKTAISPPTRDNYVTTFVQHTEAKERLELLKGLAPPPPPPPRPKAKKNKPRTKPRPRP